MHSQKHKQLRRCKPGPLNFFENYGTEAKPALLNLLCTLDWN